MSWPSFATGDNKCPLKKFNNQMTYQAIMGIMNVKGNEHQAENILYPLYIEVLCELGVTYVWKMQNLAPTQE